MRIFRSRDDLELAALFVFQARLAGLILTFRLRRAARESEHFARQTGRGRSQEHSPAALGSSH
jgi:hypothetical protein